MKNLKKITRENLKNIKGGITIECAQTQASAVYCIQKTTQCPPDPDGLLCVYACNKWCYV